MPVERNSLKQSSFCRKVAAYHETWRQRTLEDTFPRFRVLTITTSRERVKNLRDATQRITRDKGAGLFLFCDEHSFVNAENALHVALLNGRGETVSLVS